MPKQAHGGDDDSETKEEKAARPRLERFGLRPDKNVRDLFWEIIDAKAQKKELSEKALSQAKEYRFIFINIAIPLLKEKNAKTYRTKPYTMGARLVEFLIDSGSEDALLRLLEESANDLDVAGVVTKALRKVMKRKEYGQKLMVFFKEALRKPKIYPIALSYIHKINDKELSAAMKQELKIFAQGDTLENQLNAIAALSAADDEESARTIASLLSNWDVEIRRAAADALKRIKLGRDILETIKNKIESETDEKTKKTLRGIVMKWKK